MRNDTDLAIIQRVVHRHLAGLPVRVWLFGSQARGDAGRWSDVDLAIEAIGAVPPGTVGDLREAVDESSALVTVDVVDLGQASASLRDRVRAEGELWIG